MSTTTETNEVGALIRKTENQFISGYTLKSKYVSDSLYDDINKIEAYLNSKHTSGEVDSLGRDKPFFNIVIAARNIRYRATDVDRKNIKVRADKEKEVLPAFIATQFLQQWMNKENFGQFLNDWGLYLAGFNTAIVKFVEQDGELHKMVVPWTRLICDSVDFDNNPKIEILELTPAQLRQRKGYDQDMVKSLLSAVKARETVGKQKKDNKNDYIKLYEIHGNLPLSFLTGKEKDEDTFVQQMHVVSFVAGEKRGTYDDYTLVKGREEQDPYMLTALFPEVDGSVSLKGAVKDLFDAQWMVNHSVKAIKDQLDLASKLIFQTSDGNFVGQNALSAIESGDILIHAVNQPLTQVQNNSHDITSLQNFGTQWRQLAQELTATPDIMQGDAMPSGTAFRQAAIIQQEAHDNFQLMLENKGLYLEQMLRRFVIPYIKRRCLNNKKEIVALLEEHDIMKIDAKFIKQEATKLVNNQLVEQGIAFLNGEAPAPTPELQAVLQAGHEENIKNQLSETGNIRFFKPDEIDQKTWNDIFKDLEWNLEIDITGENQNKEATMTTLTTVLQTIAQNPAVLQDKTAKMLFNKILSQTDAISPIELASVSSEQSVKMPPQAPIQPVQASMPVGGQ